MCSNQILHKNPMGYVLRCNSCQRIQLTFGHVVVVFSSREFEEFCFRISRFCELEKDQPHNGCRNIVIDTRAEGVGFVFSYEELLQLELLIKQAEIVLEAQKILTANEE